MEDTTENKRKRLTIADLRQMKNYENVSDEQAQEIIFAVRNLAVMFYEHLNKKQKAKESVKENEVVNIESKADKKKLTQATTKRKKTR